MTMVTKPKGSISNLRPIAKERRAKGKPFVGVDGEGCGQDRQGRQHYMLLRAGNRELFTGKPLTTGECLDFLCGLPANRIAVSFAFGYDTTQILRDLPANRIERLFEDKPAHKGVSRYTDYASPRHGHFAIEYLPRNYLRVCRVERRWGIRNDDTEGWRYDRIEGSARTVWETFGFFQCSFLKALQNFDIGKRYWKEIAYNKRRRAKFVRITKQVRDYCEIECHLLAAMMEKFRVVCHEADIHPNQWAGAGKLAAAMHGAHKTITRMELDTLLPWKLANELDKAEYQASVRAAYYGGRFEITRTGYIGPCYEYDIHSAYPAAMLALPCLHHGTWQRVTPLWLSNAPAGALYVAECSFTHPDANPLCGLPVRDRRGWICWPRAGRGTYWSVEIRSAERLGATIRYHGGWRYLAHCRCRPFDWVADVYASRLALGKSAAGYPLKLGLASLYGKLAQRIGNPRFGNFVWAGLITAHTRALLNQAIASDPETIVMLATDAVMSRKPLVLPIGEALGQWGLEYHENLFIVQPGLYWSGHRKNDKRKTRGISTSIFARHMHRFEKAWRQWFDQDLSTFLAAPVAMIDGAWKAQARPPAVAINLTMFIGLRLANARAADALAKDDAEGVTRALVTAGQWAQVRREYRFDWYRKRLPHPVSIDGPYCLRTWPLEQSRDFMSFAYDPQAEWTKAFDRRRIENDDQPYGVLDTSPPVAPREE